MIAKLFTPGVNYYQLQAYGLIDSSLNGMLSRQKSAIESIEFQAKKIFYSFNKLLCATKVNRSRAIIRPFRLAYIQRLIFGRIVNSINAVIIISVDYRCSRAL